MKMTNLQLAVVSLRLVWHVFMLCVMYILDFIPLVWIDKFTTRSAIKHFTRIITLTKLVGIDTSEMEAHLDYYLERIEA